MVVAMTIGRGLLRLWIVLSVCWVLAIGAITWSTLPADDWVIPDALSIKSDARGPNDWVNENGTPVKPQFNPEKPYQVVRSKERVEQIKIGSVLAFAPPIVVLVLGLAFAWVVRGFRHQQPNR